MRCLINRKFLQLVLLKHAAKEGPIPDAGIRHPLFVDVYDGRKVQ